MNLDTNLLKLEIDFNVTEELIELFAESTSDRFIGDPNNIRGTEWAKAELEKVESTGMWHGFRRHGIMKIKYNNVTIGWTMPRAIYPVEYDKLMLPRGVGDIYRIGTIYVTPSHRGKGIAREVMRQYMETYPNQVWLADPDNTGSQKLATSCGLLYSGQIWFAEDGVWSHLPIEGSKSSRYIYSNVHVD